MERGSGSSTAVAIMTVRQRRVVAARKDSAMPESVLMAPGGMASREVSSLEKPRPWMISVLKVESPPLGTCRATMANQISHVLMSSAASRMCANLKALFSMPVLSAALRWIRISFWRDVSHFASSGLLGRKM